MIKIIEFEIPIRTVSEANVTEHWSKKHRRHKIQKHAIWAKFHSLKPEIKLPCHIKITRISPRKMDYDNLCSSQKYCIDALCDCLIPGLKPGRADGDGRITVEYAQEKRDPKQYGIKIEIFSVCT